MNKMWLRIEEPNEDNIGLHPDDPRRRFIAAREGLIFSQTSFEEDKLEADLLLNTKAKPGTSPGKKVEREIVKSQGKREI